MADNSGRLLALFDELSAFLTKVNLYKGRCITDSHDLAVFLELYNANPWTRTTGTCYVVVMKLLLLLILNAVTGDANFSMPRTSLTVGGFNQPLFSRAVMETPGNAEKGISQRFLWLIPKPVYGKFDSLQPTEKDFVDKIGKHT